MTIILLDNFGKRKSIRVKKKRKLNFNTPIHKYLENFLDSFTVLEQIKNKYVLKLGTINTKTKDENNSLFISYLLFSFLVSLLATILISSIFKFWYILLFYFLMIFLVLLNLARLWVIFKQKKIQSQFPEAFQIFLDYYINCKNVKATINSTYQNMPKEIRNVFQKLVRNLSSSYSYKEHILDFAKSIDNTWGYAFSEIIIMSYEQTGDITEQLVFLSNAMAEDYTDEADEKSELGVNKLYFGLIIAFTIIFFIATLIANPIASELYFHTALGNNIILIWFLVVGVGLFTLSLIDNL